MMRAELLARPGQLWRGHGDARAGLRAQGAGQAEIDQGNPSIGPENYVLGLEVAVHHARARVHALDGLAHGQEHAPDRDRLARGVRALGQAPCQRVQTHVLHDHEWMAIRGGALVNVARRGRRAQRAQDLGLARETGIARPVRDLDRDRLVTAACQVHGGKAAAPEQADHGHVADHARRRAGQRVGYLAGQRAGELV